MILQGLSSSVFSKVALFGAGVFFHGAADHAMTATLGRAPDILASGTPVTQKWLLAAFDLTITWLLYELHLWYSSKGHAQR